MESQELGVRVVRKLVFVILTLFFASFFYLAINAFALVLLMNATHSLFISFGVVGGGNLLLTLVFALCARSVKVGPVYPETLNELETDLVCLKKKQWTPRFDSDAN